MMNEPADRNGALTGAEFRHDRMAVGLTQEQLAERSGLSVRAIRDLERGRVGRPRPSTARQIASALRLAAQDQAREATSDGPPVPAQLPADVADFTGRSVEVTALTESVAEAASRLGTAVPIVAIIGAGGVGKTALAVHAAHRAARWFPDGQVYLNLAGSSSQPMNPSEALARLMRDLGTDPSVQESDESERVARYRSLTAGRRLLIVLDDACDASQVRPLLPGTGGCAVVVTSRRALHDLESAQLLHLAGLSEQDAGVLFARIVGDLRAAHEQDAVRSVLGVCAGLPLAIRIAAARVAARPAGRLATRAPRRSDQRNLLDELQTGDLAVRASFLVSYANVQSAARGATLPADRAFRLLSLADGPDVGLRAASALLGSSPDRAERALEFLVDAHLLECVAPGRYRFHDLLRVYAAERVQAEESQETRDDAIRRLLRWYLHTAGAACRVVDPSRPHLELGPAPLDSTPLDFDTHSGALAWLDAEHANLLSAVAQAASVGEHEIAWQLPGVLWDLFSLRGHVGNWLAAHKTGLASARLLKDREAEMRMLADLAGNYLFLNKPEAALDCMREILVLTRETGDPRRTAITLVNLGAILTELGRVDEAIERQREALRLFRQTGERNGEAHALCGIASIDGRNGRVAEAISGLEQGIAILREIRNFATAAESLVEMSSLRLRIGQLDAIIAEATEAVELSRAAGSMRIEAAALSVLGRAYRELGQPEQARSYWLDALSIFTAIGHPATESLAADLASLEPEPSV
jgi:tetratricopeptide (TPR) repeat protein/transcriptional regulator with XRE-family HTH domain